MPDDPFESLFNLENSFYDEGYQHGTVDGARAGRIEGRTFGLEKGFEKFYAIGRLHARATVWAGRLPTAIRIGHSETSNPSNNRPGEHLLRAQAAEQAILPLLPANARLQKHIQTLYELTNPDTLLLENTEEAVSDTDDRLKRARAKVKIIEQMVGEPSDDSDAPARERGLEDDPAGQARSQRNDAARGGSSISPNWSRLLIENSALSVRITPVHHLSFQGWQVLTSQNRVTVNGLREKIQHRE
ncbi:MAG: hypothetical protein M1817_003993 [Caeruleum heppii]|nr:MAG: hypothetical protein M1817_003993 [Caeruleum heppii]